MSDRTQLRRTVKGKRPAFHDNTSVDKLISITLALASEVSVLRDRLATLQKLGEDAGWLKEGAVEAYVPGKAERVSREAQREEYLQRLFYVMKEELDDLQGDDSADGYWSTIGKIERGDV
jgi:hypothetical protein